MPAGYPLDERLHRGRGVVRLAEARALSPGDGGVHHQFYGGGRQRPGALLGRLGSHGPDLRPRPAHARPLLPHDSRIPGVLLWLLEAVEV